MSRSSRHFALFIQAAGLPPLSVSDALALAETLAFKLGKVLTEAMSLAEALSLKTGKTLTDPLSLADAVSTVLQMGVSVTDALTILDALSLKTGKVISEAAVTLADTVQALFISLAPTQLIYKPRPLLTITIGATTKRYSTEDLATP